MIRSIFTAVGAAIKSALGFIGRLAAAPFRGLAGIVGGGGMSAPPDIMPPTETDDRETQQANAAKIAAAVLGWSANSIIDDAPAWLPDGLPDDVRAWLPGLSRGQTAALLQSDERAITAHLTGVFFIPGVPRVGRLPPATWEPLESVPSRRAEFSLDLSESDYAALPALR